MARLNTCTMMRALTNSFEKEIRQENREREFQQQPANITININITTPQLKKTISKH